MKRRLGLLILTAAICVGTYTPGYAATLSSNTQSIIARFVDTKTVQYSFSVSTKGIATYSADVNTKSANKIKVTAKVQKHVGNSWITVSTDNDTEADTVMLFSGNTQVDASETYRIYFTIEIWYGNNKKETITKYKY